MEKQIEKQIKEAYDPEQMRAGGYRTTDLLADYLNSIMGGKAAPVLPPLRPDEMLAQWDGDFKRAGSIDPDEIIRRVLNGSNHLHHPGYIGHQVSVPLPLSVLMDFVGALLNNGSAIYEMGPVNTIMEKRIVDWMTGLIGFGQGADGVLTSGGSAGNLTGLLAARQAMANRNIWKEGMTESRLALLASEDAHYSVGRAAAIMGLGEKGVYPLETDEAFKIKAESLQLNLDRAARDGRQMIGVVASSCTTATGSYDDLEMMADFCREKGLWLHVDGAHGASALLSVKYRHLLQGIAKADSVTWDAHKMLLAPALITGILFRDGRHSREAFDQKASYLFDRETGYEWYNLGPRTLECTKTMMGLRLYPALKFYGEAFFAGYVERMYDLARAFADLILQSRDFALAVQPQSNIVCFRYLPGGDREPGLQKRLRDKITAQGNYYIVKADLKGRAWLRCTIINPLTGMEELAGLLDAIREAARTKGINAFDEEYETIL